MLEGQHNSRSIFYKMDLPALLQQRLVEQEVDVFDMVVGLVLPMHLLLGLAGVDALENAQAPEVDKQGLADINY